MFHAAFKVSFSHIQIILKEVRMIRVAIVDDHAVVRAGLKHLLAEEADIHVVALVATGREALEIARQELFDVMLLDISLPDQSGIDTLAAIKARAPAIAVLSMTTKLHG